MTRATWNSLTALQVGEYVYNLSCADDQDQSMRSFEALNGLKHMMANACVPAGHQYFCNIQESCMMANGCVISTFATYRTLYGSLKCNPIVQRLAVPVHLEGGSVQ